MDRRRIVPRLSHYVPEISVALGIVLVWQALVWVFGYSALLLPSPMSVIDQVAEVWRLGIAQRALLTSLGALAVGLVLAISLGTFIGVWLGVTPLARFLSMPYLWALFATPSIAILPLLIVWFGVGTSTKLVIIVLAGGVPMTIAAAEGMRSGEPTLINMARSFGASKRDVLFRTILPNAVPYLATGVRQSLSRGFVGLLVAEMLLSSGGLGTEVMRAMNQFNTARVVALSSLLALMALGLIRASAWIESRASRWRVEVSI